MEFEINGKKYQKIEKEPRNTSRAINKFLMTAVAYGAFSGSGGNTKKRPSVDLVSEYALIQQKKSKLSRNNRDWVVAEFNRQFKEINT